MIRIFLICLFCLFFNSLLAQPGPIKMFRYFDDFSYLSKKEKTERKYFEKLKLLPIGKRENFHISLGGEIREQYQYFKNSNFGDLPPNTEADENGHLWHRFMAHADLQMGKHWRFFTQVNSTFAFGKQGLVTGVDENRFSLHQGFLEWRGGKEDNYFVRLGKQEFGYGSGHIITMREGPNTRLAFEAALFGYEGEKFRFYSFFARPVISQMGVFDDEYVGDYIWTAYAIQKVGKGNLDIFYFGYTSETNSYNFQSGEEERQTVGLRYWIQQKKGMNISLETIYQFGKFNDLSIRAYNLTADISNNNLISKVNLGLALNYGSGDKDPNDNKLNTYNILFSRPAFGLAAPIGAMNIFNIRPYVSFQINKKSNLTISNYSMWRVSSSDGTYTPGRGQIRPNPMLLFATDEKYIGNQIALGYGHQLNVNWSFYIDAAYFIPGKYVENTGNGNAITYLSAKVSFKF